MVRKNRILLTVLLSACLILACSFGVGAEGECTEHSFGEYVSDGNATCEVNGTKTATCTVCGETDTVTDIGSKGHHTDSNWETDKFEHWKVCKTCEKAVEASRGMHTYALSHLIEPTKNAEGLDKYECTFCHYSYTEPVPKLVVTKTFPTGAFIALAMVMALLSLLLFYLAFRKPSVRKKRK